MRHRVTSKHFGRDVTQRQALIKGLVRNLMLHGEITTTKAKAKETKRWADKLIGKARQNDTASRRVLHHFFGKRDVVNTLVDQIAPLFSDRVSGFTTLSVVGFRRGDNTEMVKLELVKKPAILGTFQNAEAKAEPAAKAETTKKATKAEKTPKAKKEVKPAAKKTEAKAKTAAKAKKPTAKAGQAAAKKIVSKKK